MYLIFRRDKFVGYTEEKKILKRFLKERPNKYSVQEVDPRILSEQFKTSNDFHIMELSVYDHYGKVLCEQDLMDLSIIGRDRLRNIMESTKELLNELEFVKLSIEEKIIVSKLFSLFNRMEEDLTTPESCVFVEDYFNMDSIIDLLFALK